MRKLLFILQAKEVTAGVNIKNIGQIVSERLNALRQLSANPNNVDAMNAAYQAEQQVTLLFRIFSN